MNCAPLPIQVNKHLSSWKFLTGENIVGKVLSKASIFRFIKSQGLGDKGVKELLLVSIKFSGLCNG